uniref:Uncharacterized protein n=1 Tax=Pipistrellus kuhlii TaxID=59472 RepID=A0A7J8B2U5_PIPKU|nr:hypothetical protein mPipKuh1_007863 [Pipistrellus kuhlii]
MLLIFSSILFMNYMNLILNSFFFFFFIPLFHLVPLLALSPFLSFGDCSSVSPFLPSQRILVLSHLRPMVVVVGLVAGHVVMGGGCSSLGHKEAAACGTASSCMVLDRLILVWSQVVAALHAVAGVAACAAAAPRAVMGCMVMGQPLFRWSRVVATPCMATRQLFLVWSYVLAAPLVLV